MLYPNTMGSQKKSIADVKNKKLLQTKGLVNGDWVSSSSGSTFDVVDPATLDKLATLPEMNKTDVSKAVDAAYGAFQSFKKTSARQRARLLRKWSDLCHEVSISCRQSNLFTQIWIIRTPLISRSSCVSKTANPLPKRTAKSSTAHLSSNGLLRRQK